MASSKQKTTWSKIQKESARRDKREAKAARKVARRLALEEPSAGAELFSEDAAVNADEDAPAQDETDAPAETSSAAA